MRLMPIPGAFGSVFSTALVPPTATGHHRQGATGEPASPPEHGQGAGVAEQDPNREASGRAAAVDGRDDGMLDPFAAPRVALIVTTSRCLDGTRPPLDGVAQDARGMEAVLADPGVGAFTVTTLIDRPAQEIRLGIEDFLAERRPDDQVLLYLSGLAVLDARQRLFLAGTDTRTDRLSSTSVEAGWLAERLDECRALRQIVILDTDYGSAFARTASGSPLAGTETGRTRMILTATAANRRAGEDSTAAGAGPSLFTLFLTEGLRTGRADTDGDGLISVDEAFAYVYDQLSTSDSGRLPRRWLDGEADLVLARAPRGGSPTPPGRDGGAVHPDVAHAMKVAQALDPAQALAAVQGLDAAQVLEVARVLEDSQVLEPGTFQPHPGQPDTPVDQRVRGSGSRRRHLGDALVESGVITPEQLALALTTQRDTPGASRWIGRVVVELGVATERDVAECLARMLGLELIDLSKVVPAPDVVRLLPRAVAERTCMLVIDRTAEGELVVAAADPTNVLAFDDVRLYTRSTHLRAYVATDSQIREQLNRAWSLGSDSSQVAEIVQEVTGTEEEAAAGWSDTSDGDAPIVRLVTQIFGDAVRQRASDIHIEVQRDTLRVRYRVDGVLRDVMEAPKRVATSVTSRIKIISGLDIAERRVPQDGRTRLHVDGMAIDTRVSTLPSLHGEKVVIRLLTRGDCVPALASLGLEPDQLSLVETALAVPQGLVLITGPTGSGKTNTLYSAIAKVSSPELNIVTLEDPVEVQLPGITQVGVSEKTGMTFSRGLRAILRQDPDIILVGEVRDGETAELALKAAMTGHMVLTTLHTNSAVAALTRLVDMGVEPFAVASSLTISIAQRLVRRPCQTCMIPYRPDDVTLSLLDLTAADLAAATARKGAGCHECGGTGYRGRTAVYEILNVDGPMRQVLMREPTEAAILAQARATGMMSLRQAAVLKAMQGRTTFEEAIRVTSR